VKKLEMKILLLVVFLSAISLVACGIPSKWKIFYDTCKQMTDDDNGCESIIWALDAFEGNDTGLMCGRWFEQAGVGDHACDVWKNLQCAYMLYQCTATCETGIEPCIQCFCATWWPVCCPCVQNLGIHIQCPTSKLTLN